jgi:Trypsin
MKSFIALFLLAGCGAEIGEEAGGSTEIVGGAPTDGYPYVIHLATPDCTSVLVAPRLLLTAAHCVDDLGQQDLRPDLPNNATIATQRHPDRDFAVSVLARRADIAPVGINAGPLTNDRVGDPVQIVGFGFNTHDQQGLGTKRAAWATLRDFDATHLHAGDHDTGACQGDSGGPAIMSDRESGEDKVYGILSTTVEWIGGEHCIDGGYYERVDNAWDWLGPHLASCGQRGGTRCEFNGNHACGGVGVYSPDCDVCCGGALTEPRSCGELGGTTCEFNGNNACGGLGAPSSDCDFCCR